ncbi:colanic acid biosynthesis pyruvyl transferase WcaK [Vibrio campbellii]|nr:colanic acid biosynthesis pyruvyl transferase WcaK [Vibrio campbellii]
MSFFSMPSPICPSNILILGNHSCSNRGDAAILRGLVEHITRTYPTSKITATTRYTQAAHFILPETTFINDSLFKAEFLGNRVSRFIKNRLFKYLGVSALKDGGFKFAHNEHKKFAASLEQYDLIIQVGGSFFVDLYGSKQYEAPLIAQSKKIPYIMIGHSVGPFSTTESQSLARICFDKTPLLLRESVSLKHCDTLALPNPHIIQSADTAWLVSPSRVSLPLEIESFITQPTIALTLRDLRPFDVRLGISQEEFERQIIQLCEHLNQRGYQIIFASTCTGLDGYHKDDRMVAQKIARQLKNPKTAYVVMDELDDVQLGSLLGQCVLTIGTRLHSAIISKNFGTPAFAIAYEHKSQGILNQMGLSMYSIDIHQVASEATINVIDRTLDDIENAKKTVAKAVLEEKKLAAHSINTTIASFFGHE